MTAAEIRELRAGAEEAARRGGDVLRRRFTGPRVVALKGAINLVTDADRAAEQVILKFLRSEFSKHTMVAEESTSREPVGVGPQWFIDPLDGTTNYAHGVPHFCVSVAVWWGGEPAAGAVYHPLLDDLYSAARGAGTTLNRERVGVSRCRKVGEALLATGFPYDVWTRPKPPLRLFTAALTKARGIRRLGAAALDLAYVAAGHFDGYFELGLFPWDIAAGILLVREAGGAVSNLEGDSPQLDDRQIVATNRRIHRELLAVLER
jgi:myo-inositol-1(or 4)-monophosphatase